MPNPDSKAFLGPFADYALAEFEANKPAISAAIAASEAAVIPELGNVLKALPKPKGLLSLFAPQIDAALEKYAAQLVAQHGADAVYAFLDTELHAWVKELGG